MKLRNGKVTDPKELQSMIFKVMDTWKNRDGDAALCGIVYCEIKREIQRGVSMDELIDRYKNEA
jgi:hypothetical protein